ncbi:ribosome hibernation factor-recruiting GTPase MRF [Pseudonocardia kunmingensis]|uniref:G3E family GTPase n=1 Tax=Pseudonocardia kunmingensis TaxID=630975 RepID=A0A543E1L6_9PSEU|nr:GTP-binding protein [Pseudonocardia kunmingensis]TQM15478.1 G3E family GTPase [Pseudonocardia kunmingensis]
MTRPELLVLTGLHEPGVEATAARIRALDPDVAVLHHDLRGVATGRVHRRLRHGARDEHTVLELAHGCVSCTLREDLLPQLHALSGPGGPRRIVLHLDPALEPEQVCWSLLHVLVDGAPITDRVDLRGVLTCVDAGSWLDDATGDATVAERGFAELPDDERTLAQVAVGQAELADLLVHTGTADAWQLARTDAVLARLAPSAQRVHLAALDERALLADLPPSARRGRPDDVHAPLLRGQPPLARDCGVQLLVLAARRPFHPERLHEAMDALLDGVVRTRGRIWLATRPDAVLWLESAGGGLQIGHAGDWLDGAGERAWAQASPERRAMASLGWHPRFGDRAQDLVVLVHDADPAEVEERLSAALLTDAELAAGEESWRALPDPFGWWHTDPCGPPAGLPAVSARTEQEEH